MSYYIGVDLGTSALKLLLTDERKNVVKSVSRSYDVAYPKPGWSEQNPADWWEAVCDGIQELVSDVDSSSVKGIAVAGQMHGLVVLDGDDRVIRPAILWNDGRTGDETDYLNEVIGQDKLSEYTANIAFAGFTAPKLLWMAKNEKENFEKISKIMLPKDYINYRLTGVHCTDYSDASGMLLLDVEHKCWSDEMIEICGIRKDMLPTLFESYERVGDVLPEVAAELGLPEGVSVGAGAGDNAAAAIGTATLGNGKCNISLGTSGTIFISSDKFRVDENNALHAFCHSDGAYHLMGCILSAASCNMWFCDNVLKEGDYASVQSEIDTDRLGDGDIFFLPYLMGERSPINDIDATGMFIGLRPDTTRSDMLLAVLEGVAFAVRDNVEIAKKLGINISGSTVCGGGAKSPLWMKILANVLDIELYIPMVEEGPGLGAAELAMVASGEYGSLVEIAGVEIRETIIPDRALVDKYNKKYNRYMRIYPSVKGLYKELRGE